MASLELHAIYVCRGHCEKFVRFSVIYCISGPYKARWRMRAFGLLVACTVAGAYQELQQLRQEATTKRLTIYLNPPCPNIIQASRTSFSISSSLFLSS